MSGVLVLVRNCYTKFVKRVCDEFSYGVILLISKSLFNIENDVLCFIVSSTRTFTVLY
jgi:hypothetical protein